MGPIEVGGVAEEEVVELRVVVGRELKGEELFKYHWRSRCKESIVKVYSAVRGKSDSTGVVIIVKSEKVSVGSVETIQNLTLG